MSDPRIALLGKCGPDDWRGDLIEARAADVRSELMNWQRSQNQQGRKFNYRDDSEAYRSVREEQALDPQFELRLRGFRLLGPFPMVREHPHYGMPWWRDKIFDLNRYRIERADMVFAYINEMDCFGTLPEIGHAAQLKKKKPKWEQRPLGICFGPGLTRKDRDELWCIERHATRVYEGPVKDAFEAFLDHAWQKTPFHRT